MLIIQIKGNKEFPEGVCQGQNICAGAGLCDLPWCLPWPSVDDRTGDIYIYSSKTSHTALGPKFYCPSVTNINPTIRTRTDIASKPSQSETSLEPLGAALCYMNKYIL